MSRRGRRAARASGWSGGAPRASDTINLRDTLVSQAHTYLQYNLQYHNDTTYWDTKIANATALRMLSVIRLMQARGWDPRAWAVAQRRGRRRDEQCAAAGADRCMPHRAKWRRSIRTPRPPLSEKGVG